MKEAFMSVWLLAIIAAVLFAEIILPLGGLIHCLRSDKIAGMRKALWAALIVIVWGAGKYYPTICLSLPVYDLGAVGYFFAVSGSKRWKIASAVYVVAVSVMLLPLGLKTAVNPVLGSQPGFQMPAAPSGNNAIVEIRGRGFENGQIVSEDETSVVFKDGRGVLHTIARADILSVQKQQAPTFSDQAQTQVKGIREWFSHLFKPMPQPKAAPQPSRPAGFKPNPDTQAYFAAANDPNRSLDERKEALKIAMRRAKAEGVDFRGL